MKHEFSSNKYSFTKDDFPELEVVKVEALYTDDNKDNSLWESNDSFREIVKLTISDGLKVDLEIDKLYPRLSVDIDFCQPNYIYKMDKVNYTETSTRKTPDESTYNTPGSLLKQFAEFIDLPEAWKITTGSQGVKVALIDVGVKALDDFGTNLITGKDFVHNNGTTDPELYSPDNMKHGTACASILGATADNYKMVGVCWNVSICPIQLSITMNSVGWRNVFNWFDANDIKLSTSQIDRASINGDAAINTEISNWSGLFVCSAGNENDDLDDYSNAQWPFPSYLNANNILSVGACNFNEEICYYDYYDNDGNRVIEGSNYGRTTVDLFAPGERIPHLSFNLNGNSVEELYVPEDDIYSFTWGTSYSAPCVAGVAALIKSIQPSLTSLQIKAIIMNTVEPYAVYDNKCVSGGRINAHMAVKAARDNDSCKDYLFSASTQTLQKYLGNKATLTVPSTINGEPCSTIANNAFKDNSSILSITIPNGVTSIGNSSFQGCVNLSSINLPTSLTSIGSSAFKNCTSLTSVVVPNQVSSLSNFIFAGCSSLENLTLPSGINYIGAYIVNNCNNLKMLELPTGISTIDSHAFGHNYDLLLIVQKNSTTEGTINNRWNYIAVSGSVIKEYRQGTGFIEGESQLKNLILPESAFGISLITISNNNNVFTTSTVLKSIEIPESVYYIDNNAFSSSGDLLLIVESDSDAEDEAHSNGWNCMSIYNHYVSEYSAGTNSSLTHITIPRTALGNNITSIDAYAFSHSNTVQTIDMYDNITTVCNNAFEYCASLTSVSLPNSILSGLIGNNIFAGCTSEPLILTEEDSAAESYAIANHIHYTNMVLLNGKYKINFYDTDNPNYSDVVIPEKYKGITISTIGSTAFCDCDAYEVTIPASIESIESYAFTNCSVLFYINIYSMTCSIGTNAFNNCPYLDLYVLHGSTAATYAIMNSLLYHLLD